MASDKKVPEIVNSGTGKIQSSKGTNQNPPTTANNIIQMSTMPPVVNGEMSTKTNGNGEKKQG